MRNYKLAMALAALVLIVLLTGLATAAEFSAATVTKTGSLEMPGKLYVKGDKARMEATSTMGQVVTLLRLDKQVMWLLFPGQKAYMEMPLNKAGFDQALKIPEEGISKKFLSNEVLHGHNTKKYETTAIVGGKTVTSLMWIDQRLGLPIRIESADKSFSVDYDIKEGAVDDTLFEMPAGYQKMDMPAGMHGMK